MKLQKALKEKKKIAGLISKHFARLKQSNSHEKGITQAWNAREELESWLKETESLISLKTKIYAANAKIAEKIFRLAEAKSKIQLLKQIPCQSGKVRLSSYGQSSEVIEKEAEISEQDINSMIEELELEIEMLQDELDEYNAETDI